MAVVVEEVAVEEVVAVDIAVQVAAVRIASVGSSTVGVPDAPGHQIVGAGLAADYRHPGNV